MNEKRQFTIRLNGSHDCVVLLYEYVGKKTGPAAYGGSRRLQRERHYQGAMDFAVEEDLKTHLTCW